jgi:hypothetical protein
MHMHILSCMHVCSDPALQLWSAEGPPSEWKRKGSFDEEGNEVNIYLYACMHDACMQLKIVAPRMCGSKYICTECMVYLAIINIHCKCTYNQEKDLIYIGIGDISLDASMRVCMQVYCLATWQRSLISGGQDRILRVYY